MNSNIKNKQSSWIIISYALAGLGSGALTQAFGVRVYDYYENVVLLNGFLISLAWILYGVWNSINDPLAGYLSDKTWGFTKKWGRRFPWIAITIIPFSISYVLIFVPPEGSDILVFFWFLLMICLFDSMFTIWGLNYAAILPDKFRSEEDRNKTVSYKYVFSMFGLVIGLLIPPLFLNYADKSTFIISAIVITIISVLPLILGLPGCRDTPEMIERAIQLNNNPTTKISFKDSLIQLFRGKNTRSFLIGNVCFQSFQVITLASVPYYVRSVLLMDPLYETVLLGVVLAVSVLSIPLWSRFMKLKGTKMTVIIGGIIAIAGLSIVIFPVGLIESIIAMALMGAGLGAELISNEVAFTDVIDEDTLHYNNRREGLFYGVNGFLIRFSLIFQALTFSIIHALTNYQEGSNIQPTEAIFGIRLHFGLVPVLFLIVLTIVMWKYYDLVPSKVEGIKSKIKELKL